MEPVTISRNLDTVTVELLAKIAKHDAGDDRYPNESATLRRLIHQEAQRLEITPTQPTATKTRRVKQHAA